MKQRKIFASLLALALLLSVLLTGCASSGNKYENAASSSASYNPDGGYYEDGDYGYYESEYPGESAEESKGVSGADTTLPQKLVYTADVSLETRDLNASLENVRARLKEAGGAIQDQQLYDLNTGDDTVSAYGYSIGRPRASLTIRVPSENFDSFLAGLQAEQDLFTVQSVSSRTENLTRQYYDLDSRIKALRTEEEWLLEAMEKAENVSELLEIRDRLTDVRWEIESLTNSLQTIDYDADWSTVYLDLTQVERYTPKDEADFGQRVGEYFANSGESFLGAMEGLLEVLIMLLPYLVLLAIILVIVLVLVKRSNKKRAAKMAAYKTPAPPAQPPEKP